MDKLQEFGSLVENSEGTAIIRTPSSIYPYSTSSWSDTDARPNSEESAVPKHTALPGTDTKRSHDQAALRRHQDSLTDDCTDPTSMVSHLEMTWFEQQRTRLNDLLLNLYPECHSDESDHPSSLNYLADRLKTRFEQHGGLEDLGEYIKLHQEALSFHLEDRPERLSSLNNLAHAVEIQHALVTTYYGIEKGDKRKAMEREREKRIDKDYRRKRERYHDDTRDRGMNRARRPGTTHSAREREREYEREGEHLIVRPASSGYIGLGVGIGGAGGGAKGPSSVTTSGLSLSAHPSTHVSPSSAYPHSWPRDTHLSSSAMIDSLDRAQSLAPQFHTYPCAHQNGHLKSGHGLPIYESVSQIDFLLIIASDLDSFFNLADCREIPERERRRDQGEE